MRTEQAATWLLVGWRKHWRLRQVLEAIGVECPHTAAEAAAIHAEFEFMSGSLWDYVRKCPVRAFVAAEWPRLSEHLLANDDKPDVLAACVPQVQRLRWTGERRATTRPEDRREQLKAKESLRRVTAANRVARAVQLSTQRSAWNVCKGRA